MGGGVFFKTGSLLTRATGGEAAEEEAQTAAAGNRRASGTSRYLPWEGEGKEGEGEPLPTD